MFFYKFFHRAREIKNGVAKVQILCECCPTRNFNSLGRKVNARTFTECLCTKTPQTKVCGVFVWKAKVYILERRNKVATS